jgi:ADP-heptose:LPS heptosyltransferase
MNIVIFKLSPLGDTVMMLPVVQALRRLHPDWRITVFTTPLTAKLYREAVPPENVIVIDRAALQRCWLRPWRLARWWWRLWRLRPDAAWLSFDQSSVARFLAATTGARVRAAGAGSAVRWQRGMTHIVPRSPAHSIAEWDWSIARTMMAALGEGWPDAPTPPTWPSTIASQPRNGRARVLIHAGASREYQRWFPERFAALATALARDCEVLWIDRPDVTLAAPAGTRSLAPADAEELLRLTADADLFVGNHSGPFHLAAALGRPCIVFAGPTNFFCDPPWFRERRRILRAPELACLPCDQPLIAASVCRNTAAPMACMRHWSVETVESICRDWLSAAPRAGSPTPSR